jgi:acetyl-CoA acetyltransferase
MPFDATNKVAIVGVGQSAFGRKLDRPTGALAVDAALAAIADAGLTLGDIDGLSTFPESAGPGVGPEPGVSAAPVSWMVEGLGIEQVDWWANGGGNISTAIGYAIHALATHSCNYVLVWRAMHQPRSGAFGSGSSRAPSAPEAPKPVPRVSGDAAYAQPYGITDAPIFMAPNYMRYMRLSGAKREHMAAYAVTMRANAHKNPQAIFRDVPLTFDDYMNARMIADPLCLFDCDMPVDGAGAIVLARAELAKDLKQPPAYLTAFGSGGWDWRTRPPEEFSDSTAGNLGRTLWASTHLRPSDMDGAMFYDGFSPDIYWWLEGLQFCERGTAFEFIQDGRIAIDGELPINTFGGQVSEGRLHGIGHWIEATRQIQGRADNEPGDGARQIPDAENILVATGMMMSGCGAILSKEPR